MSRGRKSEAELTKLRRLTAGTEKFAAPAALGNWGEQMWWEILSDLPDDHFRRRDMPLLEAFCLQYQRMKDAQQIIAQEGMTVTSDRGNVTVHPAVTIERQAVAEMQKLAIRLQLPVMERKKVGSGSKRDRGRAIRSKWEGLTFNSHCS